MKKFEEADKALLVEQLVGLLKEVPKHARYELLIMACSQMKVELVPLTEQERQDMRPIEEAASQGDDVQKPPHLSVLDVERGEATKGTSKIDGRQKVVRRVALTIFTCGVIAAFVGQFVIGSSLFGFGMTFAGVILAFEAYLLYKKCEKTIHN